MGCNWDTRFSHLAQHKNIETHSKGRVVRESSREGKAHGEINRNLVQVVLEDDETGLHGGSGISENGFEGVERGRAIDNPSSNLPIYEVLSERSQGGLRATLPSVSKTPPEGVRVHMIGTIPMASEMARTRSSSNKHQHRGREVRKPALTDVTIGWAHGGRGHSEDGLNCLTGPAEFGNNLFGCQ
jgi:hypothetical protein